MALIESGIASFAAGLFGSVVNRVGDHYAAKLNRDIEFKRIDAAASERKHNLLLLKMKLEGRADDHEAQFRIEETRQDSENLRGSYVNEQSIGDTYPWVNGIRALVRPVLTFGFALALVFFPATGAYEDPLINLTTMCVAWYFGARVKIQPLR